MTPPLFLLEPEQLREFRVGDRFAVTGPEGRHAADVTRLRPDEAVWIGDGRGRIVEGVVRTATRGRIVVEAQRIRDVPAPGMRFVVVQALARGGRDEAAVEAMTELGVDEVVGWQAERSVAKWTDRTLGKWESTARAATKQSRRGWIPAIAGPVDTSAVADRLAAAATGLVLDREAGARLADVNLPGSGEIVIVVGPEGGLSPAELQRFHAAGTLTVRLGDEVIRASTAGVAALAVLSARTRWT